MHKIKQRLGGFRRRGLIGFYILVLVSIAFGMLALGIDLGMLYLAQAQLQATADAAALAAASELLDAHRLRGQADLAAETSTARAMAIAIGNQNRVLNTPAMIDSNISNDPAGDVVIGYVNDPTNHSESMSFDRPNESNSALVRVRRNSDRGGSISLWFARLLGANSQDLSAMAQATFKDGVTGYRVNDQTKTNAQVLPFGLRESAWKSLLAGAGTDQYTWDEATGTVTVGPDGILELNLFPGSGSDQLPPGNFGTLDIGNAGNSTADLSRQIQYGLNESDLARYDGELALGADGTLTLNGDTGISSGIKDELGAIIGQPKAIGVFTSVSGPGNNANFTINGFAGIRIMAVKLTGAMDKRHLIVQPAFVVDACAITGEGSGSSHLIYHPVSLTK